MAPDSENRDALLKKLKLNATQLQQVANFTNNKYPDIEFDAQLEDEENVVAGAAAYINIKLDRDVDEDEEPDLTVHAPFYPAQKMEGCKYFFFYFSFSRFTKNSPVVLRKPFG